MLETVDLDKTIGDDKYAKELAAGQLRLLELEGRIRDEGIPVVVAYEGWDAAGKGGNIRRLTERLDPRGFKVYAIGAPTQEELDHIYLWRFWTKMPARGEIAIFDRTWYGRVLVERVEQLTAKPVWKRAYSEINDFERTLVDNGTVLLKVFLHIDKDEQLKRFEERENNRFKKWKITADDWRNREKWDLYRTAIDDMLEKTSTKYAPWQVIPGNSKHFARIAVINALADAIEKSLD